MQPEFHIPPLFRYVAVFLWVLIGMVNGFGGGILRDLLVGDTPVALKPGTFYVSAAFLVWRGGLERDLAFRADTRAEPALRLANATCAAAERAEMNETLAAIG